MDPLYGFYEWLVEAEMAELITDYQGNKQKRPISFSSWDRRRKTFSFEASGTEEYKLQLSVPDYSVISRLKGTIGEKLKIALEAEVKIFCSCPSFRYNGYKYMAANLDYGLRNETRYPFVRNPQLKGTVCKHLFQLMEDIDDYVPQMEEAIKNERSASGSKRLD
jgi:hypothetical protein